MQTILNNQFLVGVYSTFEKAEERVELQLSKELVQDYRRVDATLWYGQRRNLQIRPVILDKIGF